MPVPGAPKHFVAESSANFGPFLHFAIRASISPCCRGADTVKGRPRRVPTPAWVFHITMSAATSEILERSPLLSVAFIETIFTPIYDFLLGF